MQKLPRLRIPAAVLLALALFAGSASAGINRWTPVGPPGTFGPMVAVAVLPGSPSTLLAAAESGIYRSTDGGRTWTPSSAGAEGAEINRLIPAPTDPSIVLADAFGGFFRSDDAGRTWRLAYQARSSVESLAFDPTDASIVYVGDGPDLLRSTDGGETWTRIFAGFTVVQALAFDPVDADTIYIGDLSTAYKSTDAGQTWTLIDQVANGPERIDGGVTSLAVAPSDPGTVYLSGRFGNTYRSTDGGATWFLRSTVGGLTQMIVDPIRPSTIYGYFREAPVVLVSRDGGATWREIRQGLAPDAIPIVNDLALDPDTRRLYVATGESGVLSIEAGRRWAVVPQTGLPAGHVAWVKIHPLDPSRIFVRLFSTPARIYESRDAGRSWRTFATNLGEGLEPEDLTFDLRSPSVLYIRANFRFWRTVNNGRTWEPFGLDSAVSLLVTQRRTWLSGSCGLQRSTDRGRTWSMVLPCEVPNPDPNDPDEPFHRLAASLLADPFDPDTIYALVEDFGGRHPPVSISRLFVSHDDGRTWRELPISASALTFDPSRPGTLYALSGGIQKSTNGGRTWRAVNAVSLGGLSGLVVADSEVLYVSSYTQGVLRSTDGGVTWSPINAGLARRSLTEVRMLAGHPAMPHRLYVVPRNGLFEGLWLDR